MTDTVRLYIGETEGYMIRFYLNPEADHEKWVSDCAHITLTRKEYADYLQASQCFDAWQERLRPLHRAVLQKLAESRDEKRERQLLAELKAKYPDT